jgi:hypothetical protein
MREGSPVTRRGPATRTTMSQTPLRTGTRFKHHAPKPAQRFFMERLNLSKGLWLKAEAGLQQLQLGAMLNAARAMPEFLRVVALDWKDTPIVLDSASATTGEKDGALWIRPRKGARCLVLTEQEARKLPALRKALAELTRRRMEEAAKIEAQARKAAQDAREAQAARKARIDRAILAPTAPALPVLERQADVRRSVKADAFKRAPLAVLAGVATSKAQGPVADAMRRALGLTQ